MNIFKLYPGDIEYFEITEEIFFDKTQRGYPYKNKNRSGAPLYLAVCPDCENPIEIRNIAAIADVNKDNPKKPFGKHYPRTVSGLVAHDKDAYDECSLRGEVSIGTKKHRKNDKFNYEILRLLVDHALVIRELLASCIGVTVGQKLFESIVSEFITRESYKCQGVKPTNLAFAIAYWAEKQSLMYQLVSDTAMTEVIKTSMLFDINERGQVIRSDEAPRNVSLSFYFAGHHQGKEEDDELNNVNLYIVSCHGTELGKRVYKKKISYSNGEFFNAIRKEMKQTSEAAAAQREKWSAIARTVVISHCPEAFAEKTSMTL